METFTVDTHLFRELGELLVGRDSTALVELIKNAYDADATEVVVYGEDLSDLERGFIRVSDDGVGMKLQEFRTGFLRIAARGKGEGERRSLRFSRRYTGAKGVGRLAAHKLARLLEVHTLRWENDAAKSRSTSRTLVEAVIDWDLVESMPTLDQLAKADSGAISISESPAPNGTQHGTTITLRRLRRKWTKTAHGRFLEEVQTFQPPTVLTLEIPKMVLPKPLLFRHPTLRDVSEATGKTFTVKLEGDLAPPDDYWQAALDAADWVIEIDADPKTKAVRYGVAPTERTREEVPDAGVRTFAVGHPSPDSGPFFQARILLRTGAMRGTEATKSWAGRSSGVRVYVEGFRVLPYGEPSNDWLSLDRDLAERDRGLLVRSDEDPLAAVLTAERQTEKEGLSHLPNKHYFGAIFLTQARAEHLRVLVNREGFVPDATYDTLVALVRVGIDLATRVRAAATQTRRKERKTKRAETRDRGSRDAGGTELMPTARAILGSVERARAYASEARSFAAQGKLAEAHARLEAAVNEVDEISTVSGDLIREGAMLRVLASVGTQLAGFIHEINGLLGMAESLDSAVGRLRKSDEPFPAEQRRALADLHRAIADLRRNLERQASYLVDVVTPDARRRRSRQSLADRLDAGARLVAHIAERRDIKIENRIPRDLKSPPMFPAELTTVFSNLLTNAVKAAGQHGRIRATAKATRNGGVALRIENTGTEVNPENGEQWFRPFESTTTQVQATLGQGMGLGLPITRNMLEEYGAAICFAKPSPGFATALEVTLPAS